MPNRPETPDQPSPDKPPKAQPSHLKTHEGGEKKKWDIIDEHAWESFPASDPPASWAGRDIPPEERDAAAKADASDDEDARQTQTLRKVTKPKQ